MLHLAPLALLLCLPMDSQRSRPTAPLGVAWRVIGAWHIAGKENAISDGDAVLPGSLLEPVKGAGDHSITVLLPDGQRILYECFTFRDCERGFRVPPLYRTPTSTAVDLLMRVNAMSKRSKDSETAKQREDSAASHDEAVASIGADKTIEIAGLAADLSDGIYSYEAVSLSHPVEKRFGSKFEKHGRSVRLSIPSEGLFEIRISDRLNTPRIDLLLAALRRPRAARVFKSYKEVEELLKGWNEAYQGWPIHDFRRDYLRSVMLGIGPALRTSAPPSDESGVQFADVAREPRFRPEPGVFKTDTEVVLESDTAGATIHYTVDGSQPLDGAAVYRAPIIVKGTALTIKAFTSAEGMKDSPVVTGIFRIGD